MKKTALFVLAISAMALVAESCRSVSDYPIKRPRRERNSTKHFTHTAPQQQTVTVAVKG